MKKRFFTSFKTFNEEEFYNYYFLEISNKKKISMLNFYDPLNCKQKILSLNNKFLNLIFSSKNFFETFFEILDKEFEDIYKKNVFKKFDKLFKKFDLMFKNKSEEYLIQKALLYLKKTKGLKFPWDFREIECAKKTFKQRIDVLAKPI